MVKRKQILGLAITIMVAFLVLISCKGPTPSEQSQQTVLIAANLPLTGPLGTYGLSVKEGAEFAIEKIKGVNTPRLNFDWQDNQGAPKTTLSVMQKQFLANPAVYVSGVKPQTMAINDQVTAKGLPHFVWIFDPVINKDRSNNLRTWVSYKIEPPVYFSYIERQKAKRVSILYVQLPHTVEEFENIIVPGLKERGIDHVQVQAYDFGRNEFRDLAQKIKRFGPDLIILNGFQTELVGMVRALRPLSLITDGNTIATYDMLDAAKVLGPDELEGVRVVAPVFVTRPESPTAKQWTSEFVQRYNKKPLYTHAFSYDMATIIMDAAERLGGKNATSQEWLTALRATNMQGITGPLSFDFDGDLITPLEVGVYRNGNLVPDSGL